MSVRKVIERFPDAYFEGAPRSSWGPGPWEDEPDRVDWTTKAGFPAQIYRSKVGSLCGYVGLPKGHPLHGEPHEKMRHLRAHGGVNYVTPSRPDDGEPADLWWVGFDCGHAHDVSPAMHVRMTRVLGVLANASRPQDEGFEWRYRDVAYVTEVCERLARQLAEEGE